MNHLRIYAFLAVTLAPVFASAPQSSPNPFPLAEQVEAERAACLASGGAFVMSGFEDGPKAGFWSECVPNVGVRRVAKP